MCKPSILYYKAMFYVILYYDVEGQRSIKILGSKMDGSCTELMFFHKIMQQMLEVKTQLYYIYSRRW